MIAYVQQFFPLSIYVYVFVETNQDVQKIVLHCNLLLWLPTNAGLQDGTFPN
jgi:hypothetical protein